MHPLYRGGACDVATFTRFPASPLRVMAKAAGAVDLVCRLLVTVVNLRNSKQEVDAPIEELY